MTVRSRAIGAVSSVAYGAGLLRLLAAVTGRFRARRGFPVLTFHRVNDDDDPFFPSLPTSVFAARMAHIARHYVVLPLEELVRRMERDAVPHNALALTFDDGYRDNLTHAAPILARHGLSATIFLVSGWIDTPRMPWVDRLAHAIKTTSRDRVTIDGATAPLASRAERLAVLNRALRHLKSVPDVERRASLEQLVGDLAPVPALVLKRLMLTWDEVAALRGLGFAIGAHTVSHPILSRVTPDEAWEEIRGSKVAIEKAIGSSVHGFAYPNGGVADYDETSAKLVREAGFHFAVTTRHGLNNSRTPRSELRRGGPSEQHLPTFASKLAWYQLTES
jgi:peptidoglycan/xylan/chitin deacetylase (PgdA/CDA1 family)